MKEELRSKKPKSNNRLLILGASGFIGRTLYKELLPYFDVHGTYCNGTAYHDTNRILHRFNLETDEIGPILKKVQPNFIISSLRGDYKSQLKLHKELGDYVLASLNCKLLLLSSVNVFDGKFEFPSYEYDAPLAESEYGKFKLSIERLVKKLPEVKYAILRLPLVLGVNSPRIIQLKQAAAHRASFEVYPNLIISITTADKIAQQVHYIINKQLSGIFHLSSDDMVHHEDLFREIIDKLGDKTPIFKGVYRSNDDNYLAILPRENPLPKPYGITVSEVIEACTLKEEIDTIKN